MHVQLAHPSEHTALTDLPLGEPLETWAGRGVRGVRGVLGLHRHVVRRVALGPMAYVVKELPDDLARREYRLLRQLADDGLPTAEVVAVVTDRSLGDGPSAEPIDGLVITRHLEYSLPYRSVLSGRSQPASDPSEQLLDALVVLLVRLHLAGFYWGDCSLSNTLFRRDAGALSAYVIDVETGERYPSLTDGQRTLDLTIAMENVAGGLLDLQLGGRISPDVDPWEVALAIETRYDRLWAELTRTDVLAADDVFGLERRLERRLERLHELGFDVAEMEMSTGAATAATTDDSVVRIVPRVVEHGYHTQRLRDLTGLETGENQARRLLNDMRGLAAEMRQRSGLALSEQVVASTWLTERFQSLLDAIPDHLATKLEPAEIYHQFLEHRWYLSEAAGFEVDHPTALRSFVTDVLEPARDEQILEPTAELPTLDDGDPDHDRSGPTGTVGA